MTLKEFKALSEEEFEEFRDENEEEFDELMAAAFEEADNKYSGKVFEADCIFFITAGEDILEIPDDASESARGGWFPDIVTGPTGEERKNIKALMDKYGFDERLFKGVSDWGDDEDWDSEGIEDYLCDIDEEDSDETERAEKVKTILKLQQAVREKKIPFGSVNEIYGILKRYDLRHGVLYYWWEDDFIDFYDNVSYCGEGRGEYDTIEDYEWIEMLQHLEDYEVKPTEE